MRYVSEERPQPEADRHRQLLLDQLPHVLVAQEAACRGRTARSCRASRNSASSGGLSKPYSFLHLLDLLRVESRRPALPERAPSPVAPARISATSCSTGPPGTNWMMMNVTVSTPSSVGIISSSRLSDVAQHAIASHRQRLAPARCRGVLDPPRRRPTRPASRRTRRSCSTSGIGGMPNLSQYETRSSPAIQLRDLVVVRASRRGRARGTRRAAPRGLRAASIAVEHRVDGRVP